MIILVEGRTEEVVYQYLLRRLHGGTSLGFEDLPHRISNLLGFLGKRARAMVLEGSGERTYVVLVDCGGFEGVKLTLKRILRRPELAEAPEDICIVVAADADKYPLAAVRNIALSLDQRAQVRGNYASVEVSGRRIGIAVVEQGYMPGDGPGHTGQIEDNLEEFTARLHPHLAGVIEDLERRLGEKLDAKQRLLVYLALLSRKPKIRNLYRAVGELLEEAPLEHLLGLDKLVSGLATCIGPETARP